MRSAITGATMTGRPKARRRPATSLRLLPPCIISIALLGMTGCEEKSILSVSPNQPPETVITSRSPQPHEQYSYRLHLNWTGQDADGLVVGYYYAWEDTVDEEGGLGWEWTELHGGDFVVSADSCPLEPCGAGSTPYFDYHTFWVKAVDEDGAHDPTPAYRTFTATTIAPRCSITVGPVSAPGGVCGYHPNLVHIEWIGIDEDGEVTGYWYKWDARLTDHPHLPDPALDGWTYLPAESTSVTSHRDQIVPGCQGRYNSFGVFAVDDAGAVQQIAEDGINWRCFCPDTLSAGLGGLCLDGGVLGPHSSDDRACDPRLCSWYGPPVIRYSFGYVPQILAGTGIRFRWCALPSDYPFAPSLEGYSYAVDDPSEWSPLGVGDAWPDPDDPAWVPEPGDHAFHLRAVYEGGAEEQEVLRFHVLDGLSPGQRRILLVDDDGVGGAVCGDADYYEWGQFIDQEENEFWESVLGGYSYDEWDTQVRQKAPLVPDVAPYSTLIWVVGNPEGERCRCYLHHQMFLPRAEYLTSYVRAGGNVLIAGMNPMAAMMMLSSFPGVDPRYGGDVCGNPPLMGDWMSFDPEFCGGADIGVTHFLHSMLGIRRLQTAVSVSGQQAFPEDRIVAGCIAVNPDSLTSFFHRDLRIDSLKAGGWGDNPPHGPDSIDYIRAPNVTIREYLEDWPLPIYYLDSADPLVRADFIVGIVADGMNNPRRRSEDRPWGRAAFLGIHPFFLKDEDAGEFVQSMMEYFGETRVPSP